ncbi:MAG: FtsX-like permease family protein [Acidimicrobiales bacterium]
MLITALLIGIASGLAIGLAAGARRTHSAPDRYTAKYGGDPDIVVQQQSGAPLTAEVTKIPGVADTRPIVFVTSFLVAPDDGSPVIEPNPFAGDERAFGARIVEGRFVDPAAPDEFTVNRSFANLLSRRFGTRVGDQFEVTSFDQDQVVANAFDSGEPPRVPLFEATLVGITESPTDFDDPSPVMIFSQSFLSAHPTVGVVQSLIAVYLDPGVDPNTVMGVVHGLPNGGDAFAVPTRIVSDDARRAVRFQVTSLWLVTAIAAIAAAIVVSQVVARTLRVDESERTSLVAIGWRAHHLAAERAIEGAVAALIAAPTAALLAFALTSRFPLGVLRSLEPDSGPRMDWIVTLVGLATTLTIVVIGAALTGRHRERAVESDANTGRVAGAIASAGLGMALTTGARLVTTGPRGGRRSVFSLAVGAIGLAGLVASGVVGLSLTHLVDQRDRWGENYDQLFGNPFVPTENDIVTPVIDNPDIVGLAAANIGSLTINGHDTATLAYETVKGAQRPTALEGRAPTALDEIGLGAEVARRLGVHLGDHVEAAGPAGETRDLRVVGIVVTPDSAGDGAAMTFAGYAALSPTATKNILLVTFRDGAPADAADKVAEANFSPPGTLIKPTSVRALERVTAAPFLLGSVLAVLLIATCAYLLAASVRARGHDLAVLRALGSDSHQLRAIVHWQSTLVTAVVLLVGVPIGIVLGRSIVDLLTDALGIVPGADVPPLFIATVVVAAVALANLLALMPARFAARTRIAELMRDR